MHKPKLFYWQDAYQSNYRTGRLYEEILSENYTMEGEMEDSDIIIIHNPPWDYESIYDRSPWLSDRYVISYCTWEASLLPALYRRSLQLVQEVWTCSDYCRRIIAPHHNRVAYIPHAIVRDLSVRPLDHELTRRLINYEPTLTYFMNFGDTNGSRKNTHALVNLFESMKDSMPNARLVVLGAPVSPHLKSDTKTVLHLPIHLSDSQLNALYSTCAAYVSAHHSEGWGLTLSDSILFDKPIVATGYSGNLEYMDADNSFLVEAHEVRIRKDQLYHLFTEDMEWGEPNYSQIANYLLDIYSGKAREDCREKVEIARKQLQVFSRNRVGTLLRERIDGI